MDISHWEAAYWGPVISLAVICAVVFFINREKHGSLKALGMAMVLPSLIAALFVADAIIKRQEGWAIVFGLICAIVFISWLLLNSEGGMSEPTRYRVAEPPLPRNNWTGRTEIIVPDISLTGILQGAGCLIVIALIIALIVVLVKLLFMT